MKAYLKGADGNLFPLSPKVTTIGREGCDVTIQIPGVDYQHAVIEYYQEEDCFVLQDLNTVQGSYVNDVRVQNAAVRLAPADIIQFGSNGAIYELFIENPPPVVYPPVQQRPAWNQPLRVMGDSPSNHDQTQSNQGLPYITTTVTALPPSGMWVHQNPSGPIPHPPLRSRPLSAGSARRGSFDGRLPPNGQVVSSITQRSGNWTTPRNGTNQNNSPDFMSMMQDKEQKLLQLTEEIGRLRGVEMDSFRKDQLVQKLQQENSELVNRVHYESNRVGGEADLSQKLSSLENDVTSKKTEIAILKEQISKLKYESSENPNKVRQDLADKVKELNSTRNEMERIRKDKNITSGLVTQMQRDMSSKDSSLSKLSRELEMVKKELRERDIQLTAANNKITKLKENYAASALADSKQTAEANNARDRELMSLRQKFKTAENKVTELQDLVTSVRGELDKSKQSVFEERDINRKLQAELDTSKSQFLDMQRTERVVRVDLEQATKRLERFRNRIIQVAYGSSGLPAPETELTDDDLIDTLKQLIEERGKLKNHITKLETDMEEVKTQNNEMKTNCDQLKELMQASVLRLSERGLKCEYVDQEIEIVKSLTTDDTFTWMRDIMAEVLGVTSSWEHSIECALETSGFNVKLSNEGPDKHILQLNDKLKSTIEDKDRLQAQVTDAENIYKEELQQKLDALTKELNDKLTDAVEKARLEGEEKLNVAIDEIRAVEAEKRENVEISERKKIEELEASLEQLRESYSKQQEEGASKLEQASTAIDQYDKLKDSEAQLRADLIKMDQQKIDEIAAIRKEMEAQEQLHQDNLVAHREQVSQHAVTICAMEERLSKVSKSNADYQDEIKTLNCKMQDLQTELTKAQRPTIPPKPKVVIQRNTEELAALEHLISVLRLDNSELKKQLSAQQDVITGLRRDLTGASARLSDITGELSENQKQEMEQNRELLERKGKDLNEARQQMAKLSKIVDKQKEEIKTLEKSLLREKDLVRQYKDGMDDKKNMIKEYEARLVDEREEQKKQLDLLDHEGKITTELSALGAQCRGERHEAVIMRQREALAELRGRLKMLEHTRPPLPTHDQALQQVVILKKELAEMKANQALNEDNVLNNRSILDREINKAKGMIAKGTVEADIERTAHVETQSSLDSSEQSYFNLLKSVAGTLEAGDVEGLRPMAHLPRDDRTRLLAQRERTCDLLVKKIRVLKEVLARKEGMLVNYEKDLEKLKQLKEVSEQKSAQLEALVNDVQGRSEETIYLRECLNRTKDRLEQEKRLNKAIKEKKTFHLENERIHLETQPPKSAKSPTSDDAKTIVQKKAQKELLKKKDFEIKSLKDQLCSKEEELRRQDQRVMSLKGEILRKQVEVE
ncbi:forkhead-associated domain-containing protein 1 isoform X1 [Patella vulgata]|uniref:forkhead-associated domain-containing protein 1 isoform X1 n=1 Tax=Patella vulgata TaxID=6465 RepID=UPI0024A9695E|nr:forkhead-associated domain-containing protein 1 isoform X1 [Patella vulgata]